MGQELAPGLACDVFHLLDVAEEVELCRVVEPAARLTLHPGAVAPVRCGNVENRADGVPETPCQLCRGGDLDSRKLRDRLGDTFPEVVNRLAFRARQAHVLEVGSQEHDLPRALRDALQVPVGRNRALPEPGLDVIAQLPVSRDDKHIRCRCPVNRPARGSGLCRLAEHRRVSHVGDHGGDVVVVDQVRVAEGRGAGPEMLGQPVPVKRDLVPEFLLAGILEEACQGVIVRLVENLHALAFPAGIEEVLEGLDDFALVELRLIQKCARQAHGEFEFGLFRDKRRQRPDGGKVALPGLIGEELRFRSSHRNLSRSGWSRKG